ncbi:GNAT family N-acetyltransferase [Nocardia takedensis]
MSDPFVVIERGTGHVAPGAVEALLRRLADIHSLVDSDFTHPRWVTEPALDGATSHLLAIHGGVVVGFLAGRPRSGHIALLGCLAPGSGAGAALLDAFADRAAAAGATWLTVVLDTEIAHRWQRRRFFETNGFHPDHGSTLHFHRPL